MALWSVRHFVRQTESIGSLVQISLSGALFVYLGEFDDLYRAIYHSAVNFTGTCTSMTSIISMSPRIER
jgi:hypothetical protein